MKIRFLFSAFFLIGCSTTINSSKQFKSDWEDSSQNTGWTWWYCGEDENSYKIARKAAYDKTIYIVSKADLTLINVNELRLSANCVGENLKTNNVKFDL